MEQVHPENKYVVVIPTAMLSEVQESEISPAGARFTPVVREKLKIESCHQVKKCIPTKVLNLIAFGAVILLVAILYLGVIALSRWLLHLKHPS